MTSYERLTIRMKADKALRVHGPVMPIEEYLLRVNALSALQAMEQERPKYPTDKDDDYCPHCGHPLL